jgi:hypothetical protein
MEEPTAGSPSVATEAAAYRTLLERMLTHRSGGVFAQRVTAIVPGGLPTDLAFPLPLPEPHQMIGSVAMAMQMEHQVRPTYDIMFDTPLAPEAVLAFYTEHLPDWQGEDMQDYLGRQGGFQSQILANMHIRSFVHPTFGSLTVEADALPSGLSAVRVRSNVDQRRPRMRRQAPHHSPLDLLPRLAPPPAAQSAFSRGGGGSDTNVQATAQVIGALALADVATHYAAQLRAAGWQVQQEAVQAPVAWSVWQFSPADQEAWHAVLTIIQDPSHSEEFTLYLQAQYMPGITP